MEAQKIAGRVPAFICEFMKDTDILYLFLTQLKDTDTNLYGLAGSTRLQALRRNRRISHYPGNPAFLKPIFQPQDLCHKPK